MRTRKELRDRIWQLMETTLEGHSDVIEELIAIIPIKELEKFVAEKESDD